MSEQICDVSTLAWCGEETCPEQVRSVRQCLHQAVAATRVPENEITNALTIFPAGRLVITRASELESKYAAMADAKEHADTFIGKATSALESARRSFRATGFVCLGLFGAHRLHRHPEIVTVVSSIGVLAGRPVHRATGADLFQVSGSQDTHG